VSLYGYLFSPSNPYVPDLDASYRVFEAEARQSNCMACHSPNNAMQVRSLELLSYPNQALGSRHRIVQAIEEGRMPPGGATAHPRLAQLAQAFADAGDRALAFEDEPVL
jgi:hypothetical protein